MPTQDVRIQWGDFAPKRGQRTSLFQGQWADMPLEKFLELASAWGCTFVELCTWGNGIDLQEAADREFGPKYCRDLLALLEKHNLKCAAFSVHLIGQAVAASDAQIMLRYKDKNPLQQILPDWVWKNCDGGPDGVRKRAAEGIAIASGAAKQLGAKVLTGFTGSPIWELLYAFPPPLADQIEDGFKFFGEQWKPILHTLQQFGVKFALECHPGEIAFDIVSARRALEAVDHHPAFGFNYDPSHFGYQGVDYVGFIREFGDRIHHVHMKDVAWDLSGESGVFGGHQTFHTAERYWDFKSVGRGHIDFDAIINALHDAKYEGPLSVEWEDGRMAREFGAPESIAFTTTLDFPSSDVVFDAQFAEK